MFGNRIAKNLRLLGKTARQQQVSYYRLYDADMPEYALAIDRYQEPGSGTVHLYVQEYAAPDSIEPAAAARRRAEALAALPGAAQVDPRTSTCACAGGSAARPVHAARARGALHVIEEDGLKFLVNFSDYLDTGLFLDHRLTRARLRGGGGQALPEPVLLHGDRHRVRRGRRRARAA